MKRLFVAIKVEPDNEFVNFYNYLIGNLKHEPIKWVEIHNIHITLKFIGETPDEIIPLVSGELKKINTNHLGFDVKIAKTGIFGSKHDPKVIWLSVENDSLVELGENVIKGIEEAGVKSDRQNFVPHITLGRIKKITDKKYFQKIISDNKEKFIQSIYVDKFHLIESVLQKSGPVYKILETYDLKKS
jgi:2'-5' RNA ligase